jgi:hypothetical protein
MANLFIRVAGALVITAFALVFVELIPFLADPTVGFAAKGPSFGPSVSSSFGPGFSINRELKGDRLPVSTSAPAASRNESPNNVQNGLGAQEQSQKPRKIPIGCEGAFSPISSPRLAHIVGRCMT